MADNISTIRWHLWYDNYDEATAFITEGDYTGDTEPKVIAEGVPYQKAVDMVMAHNEGLPLPAWHYTPDKKETAAWHK